MAQQYYYLIAGLPDLTFADKKLLLSLAELRENLLHELVPADRELVNLWFLPYDHINITNALFAQQYIFDTRGVYSQIEVNQLTDKRNQDDAQIVLAFDYIKKAIKDVVEAEEEMSRVDFELLLLNGYYELLLNHSNKFVRKFGQFELEIRNLYAALNGRKFSLKYEHQLVGLGDVVEALKRSRARDFGLTSEIENIESLIQLFEVDDLMEREMKIDMLRWQFIDDATFFNYFSVEKVMAYLLKLMIIERWLALDEEKGRQLFHQLLSELRSSYVVPEEYKLSYGKK